jgi:hypothetical protein
MEYKHLLNRHYDFTIRTSNFEFIAKRIDDGLSRDSPKHTESPTQKKRK